MEDDDFPVWMMGVVIMWLLFWGWMRLSMQ